jgi:apolipoprotein D and lipocalin family protein
MRLFLALLPFVALAASVRAQQPAKPPLKVVPEVDLARYMGTWHEIARLPFRFEDKCASDVTATYSLLDGGNVLVINGCRTKDGTLTEAKGLARRAVKDGPAGKLKVRFAPAWLGFLPFVWGDYWIVELAPDYSYAAVGVPDRRYLWILSRTPSMDEATLRQLLARLEQNGYDLARLIRTPPGT